MELSRGAFELVGRVSDVRRVATELLSERDRHRVLEVRAAGLEDGRELAALFPQPVAQGARRDEQIAQDEEDGQARRRRIDVVGRLSHVHVIVGMHALVRAEAFPEDLGSAVGEHLVGVHVVRGPRAGLVDVDDELIAEPSVQHLVGGPHDRAGQAGSKPAERAIRLGCGLLDEDRRRHERRRRGEAADGKVRAPPAPSARRSRPLPAHAPRRADHVQSESAH